MRLKILLKKLFCLSGKRTALFAIPSFLLVVFAFLCDWSGAPAYFTYLLSAYGLAISTTWISLHLVAGIRNAAWFQGFCALPFVRRWREDIRFRSRLSLYLGFAVNLLYAVLKFVSGVFYRANWFVILALYYAFLAVMRFSVLSSVRRDPNGENMIAEHRRCRLCGFLLLMMNLVLSCMAAFLIARRGSYAYPGTLVFLIAAYTFYMFIAAVINLVRYRKYKRPLLSAAKVISMTAALASMLSLEAAMLEQFGKEDDGFLFRETMIGVSGAVICVSTLCMSIIMIARSSHALKKNRKPFNLIKHKPSSNKRITILLYP